MYKYFFVPKDSNFYKEIMFKNPLMLEDIDFSTYIKTHINKPKLKEVCYQDGEEEKENSI